MTTTECDCSLMIALRRVPRSDQSTGGKAVAEGSKIGGYATMIRVNDRIDVEFEPGMTVEALLCRCGFTFPLLVVSIDGEIVQRDVYQDAVVPDGADVRVQHLVAGG